MSTYNGERYLRQQLESIVAQTAFDACSVLIRDDGSADGTKAILSEYARRPEVEISLGEHLGVDGSYEWLLKNSSDECAYFAFCDQDDVWQPEKIELSVAALEALPGDGPKLFASRSTITDAQLRPMGRTVLPKKGLSYYNAMVQNVLPGHTQLFNAALRDLLRGHDLSGSHVVDWWVYLLASATGQIVFSPRETVLHRQHGDNDVGYSTGLLPSVEKKLQYLREGKANAISRQLEAFYREFGTLLPPAYRRETEDYLDSLRSPGKRIGYLKRSRVFRQKTAQTLGFKLLYAVGKYTLKKGRL